MLCSSQIKKCVLNFLDIIKMENKEEIYLRVRILYFNLTTTVTGNSLLVQDCQLITSCNKILHIINVLEVIIYFLTPIYSFILQESRQFIFERLSWCITKLTAVEKNIDACKLRENVRQDPSEDPMFATPMYFVNWIDYTFEVLGKLSEDVYRTDYKNDNMLYEEWKDTVSKEYIEVN